MSALGIRAHEECFLVMVYVFSLSPLLDLALIQKYFTTKLRLHLTIPSDLQQNVAKI